MTFDCVCHLAKEQTENPSCSEQWVGQYNWRIAVGKKKEAEQLRELWKARYLQNRQAPGEALVSREWQDILKLSPTLETLRESDTLPAGSFFIHCTFTLQKPYLSKDDNDFHITDNPLVREKVFRWPMVRSSGWKGALWHALWQSGHLEDDTQRCRIFGKTLDNDTGRSGRLYLYPTFFAESDLEIINPHDREKRVGTKPILLECVPIEAKGTFTLLYVPFDLIGEQVAADLQLIAAGIRAMMTTYGFGAKTSSGFGLAKDSLSDGCLCVAGPVIPEIEPSEQQRLPHSPTAMRSFASWDELVARAAELSRWLVEGGV